MRGAQGQELESPASLGLQHSALERQLPQDAPLKQKGTHRATFTPLWFPWFQTVP